MKNDPVQAALERLDQAQLPDIEKALKAKFNLVVAKAARIAGDRQLTCLSPQLVQAFDRVLSAGTTVDKGCSALKAIARALVTLECEDPEIFRRGMRHIQMEPVWDGQVDTASELRATCAVGLANTRDHRRMRDLGRLLADSEWQARAGAARAIAAVGNEAAIALLRYKALSGDSHPDVLAECLAGLIELEGGEALPLVQELASNADATVSETALLALGACRRTDAVPLLKTFYEHAHGAPRIRCILLALASSRLDEALDFVLEQIRSASASRAKLALEAMQIHRRDPRIAEAFESAARQRPDAVID